MQLFLTAHDLTCHLTLVVYNQHSPHCSLRALSLCACLGKKKIPREFPSWWGLVHQNSSEGQQYWTLGMDRLQVGKGRPIPFTEPEALCFPGLSSKPSTACRKKAVRTSSESQPSFSGTGGFDNSRMRNSRWDRVASVITTIPHWTQTTQEAFSRSILWPHTLDRHFPVPSHKLEDL